MTGRLINPNYLMQNPTPYKANIDAAIYVLARIAGEFSAHALDTPAMQVNIDPGHVFTGTALTEVGAVTQAATTTSSTSITIVRAVGIATGQMVSGIGIPAGTTVSSIAGNVITLSAAATATNSNISLYFMQTTGTITAPTTNPRIDLVVIDRMTGVASVVTGTPGATPAIPAIPAGSTPVAQILLQTSSTVITDSMITDMRDFSGMGMTALSQVSIASASTTDLGTMKSDNVLITGTTTITSFGSSASLDAPIYFVEFSGATTITYNATLMKTQGSANIVTAAGDTCLVQYLGSGNWNVFSYQRKSGQSLAAQFTPSAQCVLSKVSANLSLGPWNGNLLTIANQNVSITSPATIAAPFLLATTNRARTATVATITFATAHGLSVGDQIEVQSMGGTGYNTINIAGQSPFTTISAVTTTTISYPVVSGSSESTTADTAGRVGWVGYVFASYPANVLTLTFEPISVGRAINGATGFYTKTGDTTKTLVGMAALGNSSGTGIWLDTYATRFVLSWFNRKNIPVRNFFATNRTASLVGSWSEFSPTERVEFLSWSDESTQIKAAGYSSLNTGAVSYLSLAIDSSTSPVDAGSSPNTLSANGANPLAPNYDDFLSDGYHFATILGYLATSATIILQGSTNFGERTTISAVVRG